MGFYDRGTLPRMLDLACGASPIRKQREKVVPNAHGRVLKPGGKLHFSEHGRAPDESVARLQNRRTPHWKKIAGGCELNRDIPATLKDARFELLELDTMYVPRTPRAMGHMFWGRARPASAQ